LLLSSHQIKNAIQKKVAGTPIHSSHNPVCSSTINPWLAVGENLSFV